MGDNKKSLVLLLSLVLSIYYLRSADISPSGMLFNRVRILYSSYVTDVCGENDPYELFTQSQRDSAASLQETVSNTRGGNQLSILIQGGSFASSKFIDYVIDLAISTVIPLAAMFVITFIGYDSCMFNWCCMYGCCKNCCNDGCLRCCKPPRTTKKRTIYLIGALLFCVAIFGASIAGIVAAGGLKTGVQKSTCSAISFMDTIANGNTTEAWIGISPALAKMVYIGQEFGNAVNSLSTFSTSTTNLQNKYNTAITDVDALYTNYKDESETRPDPANAVAYTISFSADGTLGPSSTKETTCGAIKAEFDIKNDAITIALQKIDENIQTLKTQTSTIQTAIDSGTDIARTIDTSINDYLKQFSGNFTTANDIGGIISTIVQVIFIISLVFGVAALASILLVKMCKINCFNKVTHCTWCILGLFTLLGFLISAVLYPVSIVLTEMCGVLDSFLNDSNYFNNIVSTFKLTSFGDTLNTCIYGDGNILKRFDVESQLGYFDIIFAQLGNTSSFFGNSIITTSPTITAAKTAVQDFIDGKTPDHADIATDVVTLNSYTNNGQCAGTSAQDTWVLGSSTCASGSTVLASTDNSNTNIGSATCIGFDQWGTGNAKTGAGRYGGLYPGSCSQVNSQSQQTYVETFVDNFKTNRAAVGTYFGNVKTQLNTLDSDNTAFMTEVTNLASPFDAVNTTLTNIFDAIRNPTTGIISNAKCSFFGNSMRRFKDALCIGLVLTIYQIAVCLIVVSAFTLLGTFFVFCFAKRALVKDDESAKA